MRTLTSESDWDRWIQRNRIVDFFEGKRRYDVSGSIAFEFADYAFEPDVAQLANEIREIDKLFPWRDNPNPRAESQSIRYLSDGKIVIHNFHTPLKVCWFHVYPVNKFIRKGQVYAYEKYLDKIAEELAKKKLPGVVEVRSVLEVHTISSFKA